MSISILVVEDEAPFRYYLTRTLQMHGYQVEEAEDGLAGYIKWVSMEPKPDLVLSNISMPRLNGIDLARKLRDHDPNVIILFVSAEAKPEFDLLRKPFRNNDLIEAVRKRLDGPRSQAAKA
jgi:CheY-like chemotaxis protein